MLLINQQRLLFDQSFKDEDDPMHAYAVEYDEGIRKLRKKYPEGYIKFLRVGYPKFTDGVDSKWREVRDIPEDVPPERVSLRANFSDPKRGIEEWGVCLGAPEPQPGGLWALPKNKRSMQITQGLTVDLKTEAELAFFFAYKSPHFLGGHWKIDDPKAEAKERGDAKRRDLERNIAIYQRLSDDEQLKRVAAAYLIIEGKEPDVIREELEALLIKNDSLQESDPSLRGTKEFLEDMKITDYTRLCYFLRDRESKKFIVWKPDGKYKVGDKTICHVPHTQTNDRFRYMANYYASRDKEAALADLVRDVADKAYLAGLSDNNDFRWLAKALSIEGYYNKPIEQVKEMVYKDLGIVPDEAVSGSSEDKE